jgi:hypothetical protein
MKRRQTNENVDEFVCSNLPYRQFGGLSDSILRQTSSRIITSQLCNLSEDRLDSRDAKSRESLCTARQDSPDCFFVRLSKFHSSSQLSDL